MNEKPLVIYHGECRDGFCAAWVVYKTYPDAEFFAGRYGQDPPDVKDRDVVMVDFSYKRPVLERMADDCASMLILDHHKTAQADLEGFIAPNNNVNITFDMERSGAGITWDHYQDNSDRPWFVNYVEDRDLWNLKLPFTKEIGAYLGTVPYTFTSWDALGGLDLEVVRDGGRAVEAKIAQYIREVGKNAQQVEFHGHKIPLVNAPQVDISELLNVLAKDRPFSMGWWQRSDGMYSYGLRSIGDFDVSEIAKKHGGGGHKNAAGFQLDKPLVFP